MSVGDIEPAPFDFKRGKWAVDGFADHRKLFISVHAAANQFWFGFRRFLWILSNKVSFRTFFGQSLSFEIPPALFGKKKNRKDETGHEWVKVMNNGLKFTDIFVYIRDQNPLLLEGYIPYLQFQIIYTFT